MCIPCGGGGIETDGSSSNMMIEFENNARESEKDREREKERWGRLSDEVFIEQFSHIKHTSC